MDTKKKETTELSTVETAETGLQASPSSPMAMAMELCKVNSDMSIEKMEKILEMQERFEANQARKDFTADFAVVQSKIDAVVKTKVNPQTRSNYAGLDDVLATAKPVYTEHGFSVIFYEGNAEKEADVRVCADVLHKAGHKETYHYDVPMGGKGIQGKVNMIDIHAKATSVTYGRRYLLCMIWNIPTQDKDGNPPADPKGPPKPTDEEQKALDVLCNTMVDSVPEGETLDRDRIKVVTYARWNHYPKDDGEAGRAARSLIDQFNKDKSWATVCQKP